jgi:protein-disulfide isomerase
VLEKYPQDVKVVHKNYPRPNQKIALDAAKAALAAHRQGRFWDYHHKLFENYKQLDDAKFEGLATDLGLDLERFKKDMDDASIQELINRDVNEGRDAGIRGIPTIFINGKLLKSRDVPGFLQKVNAELQKRKPR